MAPDKTLIILDTNFLLEGKQNNKIYSILSSRRDLKEFLEFLNKNDIRKKIIFGIPDIVFEEHFYYKHNDFNLDLENLKEKVSQFNDMEILDGDKLSLKFKDKFDYKKFLQDYIQKNKSFISLKTPEKKKKGLFERTLEKAINHKKPFHKKGDRNFKDALIWECICCQNFRNYASIILLTDNRDDFPENSELEEINRAAEKTGKIIKVLYSYRELEKELEKIYMFVEKEIQKYILEYFKDKIKEDAEGYLDCIFWEFNIKKETIKIEELKYSDLKDLQMEELWEDKENIRVINFEFEGEIEESGMPHTEHRNFLGEIFFDNGSKEIVWSRYDGT